MIVFKPNELICLEEALLLDCGCVLGHSLVLGKYGNLIDCLLHCILRHLLLQKLVKIIFGIRFAFVGDCFGNELVGELI